MGVSVVVCVWEKWDFLGFNPGGKYVPQVDLKKYHLGVSVRYPEVNSINKAIFLMYKHSIGP